MASNDLRSVMRHMPDSRDAFAGCSAQRLPRGSVERETGLGVRSLSPAAALRKQRDDERESGSPEKRARRIERVPEKPRSLKKAIGFAKVRSAFFRARRVVAPLSFLPNAAKDSLPCFPGYSRSPFSPEIGGEGGRQAG